MFHHPVTASNFFARIVFSLNCFLELLCLNCLSRTVQTAFSNRSFELFRNASKLRSRCPNIKRCSKRCLFLLLTAQLIPTFISTSTVPPPISINSLLSFLSSRSPPCAPSCKSPALSLGQRCEYDASCKWMDKYSECAKEEQRCRCMGNYMPKVNLTHGTSCVQSR